jgi:hypothetical protein
MNKLIDNIEKTQNRSVFTENSALSNASTLDSCVDLFGKVSAMRNSDTSTVLSLFRKAFAENKTKALKILFYARDIRGGQGERKTFRTILKDLAKRETAWVTKNLDLIPEYGRWDDLYVLVGTPAESTALSFMFDQFSKDMESDTPSILAKWLKRENTSSKESRRLATLTRKRFDLTPRAYRKAIASLCEKIKVVEQKMCAGEWNDIDYGQIPSNASLMYRKAFSKHDPEGYQKYLGAVERGEAEIKTATLYPYDLVSKYLDGSWGFRVQSELDRTIEAQWKNLPNYVEPFNGIVVADTSGSMYGKPIEVCISLAIYIAERNIGEFKDRFITFSQSPKLQKVVGDNLRDRIANLARSDWGMNTNVQAVFDLVLDTATKNKLSQDDLPERIFIVSDMQFDVACRSNSRTNFEQIKKQFKKAGYKMPQLVFWNVDARNNKDQPITIHDTGTALVSGCSPSILKAVLANEVITPTDVMNSAIETERYERIQY